MQDDLVRARLVDVAFHERGLAEGERVRFEVAVLETDDGRILPIFLSRADAASLALVLTGATTSRPLTHRFAADLLIASGATVAMVVVDALADSTFRAKAHVVRDGAVTVVDGRPSDCLTLALLLDCPVYVAGDVLSEAGWDKASVKENWYAGHAEDLLADEWERLKSEHRFRTEERKSPPHLGISLREEQVLRLVAAGHTNGEVARTLGLSPFTVTRHLANIYSKLGVSRRAQAVARLAAGT